MAQEAPDEINRLRAELLDFVLAEIAVSDVAGLRTDLAAAASAEVERKLATVVPQWTTQITSDRDALADEISERVLAGLSHAQIVAPTQRFTEDFVATRSGTRASISGWQMGVLALAGLALALGGFGYVMNRDANASAALAANQSIKLKAQCNAGAALRQGLAQIDQPKKGLEQCDPKLRETKPSAACAAAMAIDDGLSRLASNCPADGLVK